MFLLVGEPAWDSTPRNKKAAKDTPGVWGSRQSQGRGEGHPDGLGSPSLVWGGSGYYGQWSCPRRWLGRKFPPLEQARVEGVSTFAGTAGEQLPL